ncbi:branched-chain amino acid transport system II carrier protein [Moraxella ovis]|nr:branched-chain amino acid transport system II carrier protein [Moraxella ovis]
MDMIASVAFSVVVMSAISQKAGKGANLFAETTKAGLIATSALALIYLSLGWIGNHLPISADELTQVADKGQNIGTFILNKSAVLGFGSAGGGLTVSPQSWSDRQRGIKSSTTTCRTKA